MTIFVDCDGVLAHFDQQLLNMFGFLPMDFPGGDDGMWEAIEPRADEFWSKMPVKWGALDLWKMVLPYDPIVLTGCPKGHFEVAAAHKVEWIAKHIDPNAKVITCLSRNKPLHMTGPGDILIDDMSRNVRRWVKAGGVGVHYRTAMQAMEDFGLVMAEIERAKQSTES